MISRTILALAFGLTLAAGGAVSAATAVKADGATTGIVKTDATRTDAMKTGVSKTVTPAKPVAQRTGTTVSTISRAKVSRMSSRKGSRIVTSKVARSHHAHLRLVRHVASIAHAAKRPLAKRA